MTVLIFFNLFLIPMVCIFLSKHRNTMNPDINFWSAYGCISLVIHVFSEICFRYLFKGISNNLDILCSFKYTLIAFVSAILLTIVLNFIPKNFFAKDKE